MNLAWLVCLALAAEKEKQGDVKMQPKDVVEQRLEIIKGQLKDPNLPAPLMLELESELYSPIAAELKSIFIDLAGILSTSIANLGVLGKGSRTSSLASRLREHRQTLRGLRDKASLPERPTVSLMDAIDGIEELIQKVMRSSHEEDEGSKESQNEEEEEIGRAQFLEKLKGIMAEINDNSAEAAEFKEMIGKWIGEIDLWWLRHLLDEWYAGVHDAESMSEIVSLFNELQIKDAKGMSILKERLVSLIKAFVDDGKDEYLEVNCKLVLEAGKLYDSSILTEYLATWRQLHIAELEPILDAFELEAKSFAGISDEAVCLGWLQRAIPKMRLDYVAEQEESEERLKQARRAIEWLKARNFNKQELERLDILLQENTALDTKKPPTKKEMKAMEREEMLRSDVLLEQVKTSPAGYIVKTFEFKTRKRSPEREDKRPAKSIKIDRESSPSSASLEKTLPEPTVPETSAIPGSSDNFSASSPLLSQSPTRGQESGSKNEQSFASRFWELFNRHGM